MRRSTSFISSYTCNAAALALLLLGASACGHAGASTPSAATVNSVTAEYESPIARFLGVDLDASDQQDVYIAAERDRIDWVTTCMANQGFEYRSEDPTGWLDAGLVDPDAPEWGSDEWVAIYGFGVSTQMFDQAMVGTDLVGATTSNYDYVDPNAEYMQTLSAEEQTAYYTALHGNDGYLWDSSMSDEENQAASDQYFETLVPTGCESLSYDTFAANDPYAQLYENFGDELASMYERVESDAIITQALADISRCASQAGFSFTDEQSVQEEIYERLEPVQNAITWPYDHLTEADWANLSEDELQKLEQQGPTISAEGKALLAEVQHYEIEMATAVYGCGYGDMQSLFQQVLTGYEQQFVDTHRAELEAFVTN